MAKKLVALAAFFGFIAIILGAFGAHALKKVLTVEQLISFETGVRYQMYHALFLLLISQLNILTEKNKRTIGILTTIGVFLFSGSIFLLATQDLSGINFKFLGPITPVGGLFLILSWFFTAFYALKQNNN
ncbi:DUF423 domain-containing protein [Flavobacterium sp. xlx-214]|uniref:DUF423 domain-containing protein n=1 Tax=unclassified Flavobacterium TaxID=196869 RepID=UPI0013D352B3|nr:MULTISPECIES: DUF423 domain-containing protein [unclassified Flavobacterium]MBA5792955.1 DUF423 domain-containing protein [Flavobacterium sp. xlx-221]QMI84711.1 DUF423 domain-containing protein [Flavobacterium sp. xlx-214]